MTALDMRHSPSCQRLVIVVTRGYSHTISRCDECGAISTVRHCAPTPDALDHDLEGTP